jgi:hypothetical protein
VDLNPIQAGIGEPPEASDFICVKGQTTTTKNTKLKSEDLYVFQRQRHTTERRLHALRPLTPFVIFVSFVLKKHMHDWPTANYNHEEHEVEIRRSLRLSASTSQRESQLQTSRTLTSFVIFVVTENTHDRPKNNHKHQEQKDSVLFNPAEFR